MASGEVKKDAKIKKCQAGVIGQLDEEFEQERFIPVTRFALADRLRRYEDNENARRNAPDSKAGSCFEIFPLLSLWRHQCYQKQLADIRTSYLPFSPDRDTVRILPYLAEQLVTMQDDLVDHIIDLLKKANYVQIDEDKLESLLQANSAHGLELNVDLTEFDAMLLFSRGHEVNIIEKRTLDRLFLFKRRFEVPIYRRLFLLLKLKSVEERIHELMEERKITEKRALKIVKAKRKNLPSDPEGRFIYLRLFKNIPQEDLEMMFPNTEVRLKMFDKVKLGVTAGGGTVAGIGGAASKVMAAIATANPIALAAALAGVIGLIFRQVMNVFNTRTKYMMQLAQRLFFHALANNRGALMLLADRAEEEEIKEDMLLYFFLLRYPSYHADLLDRGRLDIAIEDFLADEFSIEVNFDIEDAVERLRADGIVRLDQSGLYTVLEPIEVKAMLQKRLTDLVMRVGEHEDQSLSLTDA